MASRNISLVDDAYKLLLKNKIGSESFSEVIKRVLSKNRDIMEFAGALGNLSNKEIDKMKREITKIRDKSTRELLNDLS
ncbi:hypothetical protein COU61_01510 [Candidatus Pacearchaeota archaeon CG10_big_fil_rev_8_21_14_0_10_35_13]|nr:MAG: hypothetical protein COU61_01510 [Candidatus Pacearchaeota archaeon CG10_big_fil_rev_8_21_14_0_10_35_13]